MAVSCDVSQVNLVITFEESESSERQMTLCVSVTDRNQLNFLIIVLEGLLVKIINMELLLQISFQGSIL